jgi:dipeptidyl aminopeptidase/acylaminoacyl peptidase
VSIFGSWNRAVSGWVVTLVTTLLGMAPVARGATPPGPAGPPAAAFGTLPQMSDVQLSPNGRLLAWTDQSAAAARVVIFDLAAKAYRRTVDIDPALKERSLQWSDDHTVLVTLSATNPPLWVHLSSYEMFRTLSVNVDSGETHMLLMGEGEKALVTGAYLLAWHTAQPHTVVMATLDYALTAHRQELGSRLVDARADSGWILRLFDVDTRTGKGTIIDQGDQFTDQWVVDAQGAPVARSEWRPSEHRYLIEAKVGQGWRTILDRRDGTTMTLYGVCTCGNSVVATAPDARGRIGLWAVALDGSGTKELLPDATADVEDVIRDRFSGAPVGVDLGGLDAKARYFDPTTGSRNESVARAFPGAVVNVYSRSEDGSRVIAKVEGPSRPPVYYLVDFNSHHADIVGEAYPGLDNVALGEVRDITYAARDGTAIPAYLTLPPGVAPKSLPMVVLPHGGPESRDTPGFDWLAQFFATRGYAVLQPEFRGSTGFGDEFERAGKRQWGGLMQNDVTDGVKAMIHQGIADPRRICIVGASYGGYAALAGAAFTPDLYACAVSINGVSDLPGMLMYERSRAGTESDVAAYWTAEIGAPSDPKVVAASPVNDVADIKVPVLLLHATDDTVVPFGQSQKMADALARLGKPVSLIKLTGEDHWLSRGDTRTEVLEDTESFLRKYLQ